LCDPDILDDEDLEHDVGMAPEDVAAFRRAVRLEAEQLRPAPSAAPPAGTQEDAEAREAAADAVPGGTADVAAVVAEALSSLGGAGASQGGAPSSKAEMVLQICCR
jgi:hypothetical protein